VSRFSYRELVLTLTAAAREIAETWPKVRQLEAPVLPLGKSTGSVAHIGANYSGN
jgi:hypothetical protein